MEAIELTGVNKEKHLEKEIKNVIFRKRFSIDYDQKFNTIPLPPTVKEVSDDVVNTVIKMTGKREVELILFDFGLDQCHEKAKEKIKEAGAEAAGLHEILHFSHSVKELFFKGEFSISALRDEWIHGPVEFIPTIYCPRENILKIRMYYRHDLPFKQSYFLGVKYV